MTSVNNTTAVPLPVSSPVGTAGVPADLAELRRQLQLNVQRLQDELNRNPDRRDVFTALTDVLLLCRLLRGRNLESLTDFVVAHWHDLPWVREFRTLIYLPRFLNIAFVGGRCNLRCRMCHGMQAAALDARFSCVAPADFERMLAAAPTASGVTLSAADSDPLLHPELEAILGLAQRYETKLDMYTNGQALSSRTAQKILAGGTVSMLNFSLDAATPQTYTRIRGAKFESVLAKIELLQTLKREHGAARPVISLSFVAMADNIAELPDFVALARRLGAVRVYVEDLIGWGQADDASQPATENARWEEYVRAAQPIAAAAGIVLKLPDRLRPPAVAGTSPDAASSAPAPRRSFCDWLQGVWVDMDGKLQPCCLLGNVADMGSVFDGPLHRNAKFTRTKDLLLAGRVFARCVEKRACGYVQQQRSAGVPLDVIAPGELA